MTTKSKMTKANGKAKPKSSQVPKKKNKVQVHDHADSISKAPSASSKTTVNRPPKLNYSSYRGDSQIVVRHREYIGDVMGSFNYSVKKYEINAGLDTTFRWLSALANNYEFYRFRKLSFEFETSVGTNTIGSVMLAVDYDPSDVTPGTKADLLATHDAVRSAIWDRSCFICDNPNLGRKLLTRNGSIPANTDKKLYDIGSLYVAISGNVDETQLGELYVSYEVELHTPQPLISHPYDDSAKVVSGGAVDKTMPLGAIPVFNFTEVPLPLLYQADGTMNFQKVGQYLLDLNLSGTGITATSPTLTGTAAFKATIDTLVNGTATAATQKIKVNITEPGQTIKIDETPSAGTITAGVLRIAPFLFNLS